MAARLELLPEMVGAPERPATPPASFSPPKTGVLSEQQHLAAKATPTRAVRPAEDLPFPARSIQSDGGSG